MMLSAILCFRSTIIVNYYLKQAGGVQMFTAAILGFFAVPFFTLIGISAC
ncbi:conserved hypothetical protein [Brochothrix thermosphacta]|uniref:Uncharacterized protein n=1 Tax=Brochothrix thermosphacta TaxID=2756 RepID=A0A2X0QI58_BROTH|nr:conserved hypothetical protein [Brochothrix thermosphacta]